jgi:prolyl oligopeptidase
MTPPSAVRFVGRLFLAPVAAIGVALTPQAQPVSRPTTEARPVVDEYHGVKVADPYRWLENWSDPEVRDWTSRQDAYTRAQLDALPFMTTLRARVQTVGADTRPRWSSLSYRKGRLFAIKRQPPHEQPMLVVLSSPADLGSERIIVDPVSIDSSGHTAIDFYEPSPDGSRVAVSLSEGGTERGDVRLFDVDSGRDLGEIIPRVNGGTAGGSVVWNADGTGLFYTRYPRPGERPNPDLDFYQQIYFHRIGGDSSDAYEIGRDFPKIAETVMRSSIDGRFVVAAVSNGDGGEHAFYVRPAAGQWIRLAGYPDEVVSAVWGRDNSLYLLSRKNAPRGQVLRIAPSASPALADARVVVPESDGVIEDVAVTASRIYVHDLLGGPSRIRVFDRDGRPGPGVALPPISSVTQLVGLDGDDLLYEAQSYVTAPAYYRTGPATAPLKTALAVTAPVDFSDIDVTRTEATSTHGAKIPLNIVSRKGTKLDGTNPTLLTGYGGYGISQVPTFSAMRRLWLEQGGVFVVANLRGGGEFGEAWHRAGNLTNKQNVFDDFVASARYLIERRYTSPETLSILGGSNGGLLMGAVLTQHPELFRAVVSHVGIYDMLRVELYPNGAFNVTEFGTVTDPPQFRALHAYSPYHHVSDGVAYPAVLLFSGINDPRVNPADSRKFTARLQAATSSSRPILLRVSGSGHGIGTSLSEGLSQQADQYGFLFSQLGIKPTFPR